MPSQAPFRKIIKRNRIERAQIAKIDSQEVKDSAFATAFLENPHNAAKALLEVDPEAAKLPVYTQNRRALDRVLTPGVQAVLAPYLQTLEKMRGPIMSHLYMMAMSDDPAIALPAIDRVCKIAGWFAATKIEATAKNFNIHSMLQDPDAVREALALMSHEPGAAVAIQSDARDEYERRHGKVIEAADEP